VKFGVMNLFPAEGASDHLVLRETLEEIRFADELGFDSAWLAEHHFSRYGILGNPLLVGAAIAEATERIRVGTAVVVLPFHDPIRLAEDAATLDVISNGRLDLGIGRGYQPQEFAGFGIDPAESKTRYAETVDILRKAWTQDGWSHHGEHFTYDDLTVHPRPVQPGGPPLLHASVSPDSFTTRGLAGERIITSPNFTPLPVMRENFEAYRAALGKAGHDASQFDIPFMQQAWVGHDEAGLRAAAEAALPYYRKVGKVIPGSENALSEERRYYEKVRENIELLTLEQTLTHGGNFGSVDHVVDTLGRLQSELGVTHYIGWFHIPSIDRKHALQAMEVFATEVIPQLRDRDRELEASR
jgi:alkanesulfonate monooxygenase SsuD/methylene tetrahydromethanopterin reductase-like flavin-dependent oxidoreductase (luciferase family)